MEKTKINGITVELADKFSQGEMFVLNSMEQEKRTNSLTSLATVSMVLLMAHIIINLGIQDGVYWVLAAFILSIIMQGYSIFFYIKTIFFKKKLRLKYQG